jgi:hypothetical protein
MWTYKTDHAAIFTAACIYEMVGCITFDHDSRELRPVLPADTRSAVSLLRKSLSDFYLASEK